MSQSPLVVVSLSNAWMLPSGGVRTLDLDPDVELGRRLLERLRAFGYDRFFLTLFLYPAPWAGAADLERTRGDFQKLATEFKADSTIVEWNPASETKREMAMRGISEWAEKLPVGEHDPILRALPDCLFVPRESLAALTEPLGPDILATSWRSEVAWERPAGLTRAACRIWVETGALPTVARSREILSPLKSAPLPFYVRFGVTAEYKEVFRGLMQRPAAEWSYSELEKLWKTAPECFRGSLRHVGVELTNEDNLKRLRSPAIISKRPVTRLSRENWNALLDDLPFDLAPITMDFWDFGEPLLHPDAIDFIREASARGIRSDLYTNGLLLDEPKIDRLLESGLEALFYRLDAATPNTYGKVSGDAAPYARAVANLELLLKKKKRRGGSTIPWRPIVSVQITEMPETADDVDEFFSKYDHGDRLSERHRKETGQTPGHESIWSELYKTADPIEYVMLRHDNLFRGRVTRADATDMTPLHRYSCRQWRAGLYVLADGSVVPCREDVDGEQALGRVEDGLRAIWTGEKSARFHNLHERGQWDEDSFCASCKEWYYNFE